MTPVLNILQVEVLKDIQAEVVEENILTVTSVHGIHILAEMTIVHRASRHVKELEVNLTSSGTTRLSGSKKDSGSGSSMKDKDREMAKAINAEFSDDDDDVDDNKSNWDDDEKPQEHEEEEEEDDDDDEEDDVEGDKKKKDEKRKKEKQERERHTEDEEEKDDEAKDDEDDVKHGEDDAEDEERDENDKGEHPRGAGNEELPSRRDGRRFIKLSCPHCAHRSVTFKEYSLHLYSGRHNTAMRRVAARYKAMLARMRVVQRQEQRRVETRDAARGTLPSRTIFCPICKLNYRSLKAMHQLSDSHRQMKRFLTPFCRVCRMQFRSPMSYETHVCSLDHIKRKSMVEERMNNGSVEAEADSSGPDEDDKEVNLDNFMTLDSVGDVDAEEDEEAGDKKKKEKPEGETTAEPEKKPKTKQMIKVGAEYIKRVEVQFCELCKVYLPQKSDNSERAIALHCSSRIHLKRYVRDNDDKALRRQAERIHLQTSTSANTSVASSSTPGTIETTKTSTADSPQPPTSSASGTTSATATGGTSNVVTENVKPADQKNGAAAESENKGKPEAKEGHEEEDEDDYHVDGGDKLWDDVDKDLGVILRETEPGTKSSDDEDSRYDRFRNSDTKLQLLQHGKEKERDNEQKEVEDKDVTAKKTEVKVKIEKLEK
ncbi:zinc finger protein on ecdysone puffs isoform X3 [Cephus cinctus]|uniref:Zinc finger protein on ecdysone puffs isoform X3 n=1 Tax=Cephus cinctus TaxID=211228 RepID=A0AAJ7RUZ9_CEPCN|nr:zinc finger protein on ecdysone puffs isoform X3 [Cephus cinctus]